MATTVGLLVLGGLVALFGAFVPEDQLARPMWVFVYAGLAAAGLFCWNHHEAPSTPNGWLSWAGASIVLAALLFAVDAVVGWIGNSDRSFVEAVTSSGWYVVNFAICPFGTFVALAGWARGLLLPARSNQ